MAEAVAVDRVVAGVVPEDEEQDENEQDPAHRIAGWRRATTTPTPA